MYQIICLCSLEMRQLLWGYNGIGDRALNSVWIDDWENQDKLANLWYCLEPAAYVEVHSIYNPVQILAMEPDHTRVDQVVSEIIRQAAMEHEIKKQQWFLDAKDNHNISIKWSRIKNSPNEVLKSSLDLL